MNSNQRDPVDSTTDDELQLVSDGGLKTADLGDAAAETKGAFTGLLFDDNGAYRRP